MEPRSPLGGRKGSPVLFESHLVGGSHGKSCHFQQSVTPKIDLAQWPRRGSPKGRGRGHWVPRCRRPRAPPAAQLLNALSVASAPPGALVLGRPARAPQSAARALRPAPGEGPVPGSHEGGNPPAPPPAGPPARSARKNGLELRDRKSVV